MTRAVLTFAAFWPRSRSGRQAGRLPLRPSTAQGGAGPGLPQEPREPGLQTIVLHLRHCITDPVSPESEVAGIDLFLSNLEKRLRKGNDPPRDRILRNADLAREYLRLAYNDMAEAAAPDLLSQSRDKLKDISDQLAHDPRSQPRLRRSAGGHSRLCPGLGRRHVHGSPGLDRLVDPRRGPFRHQAPAPRAHPPARQAQGRREEAPEGEVLSQARQGPLRGRGWTGREGGRAGQGRRGPPKRAADPRHAGPVQDQDAVREVILNANKWLKKSVEKGEEIAKLMEAQLDPKQEGMRKTFDKSVESDGKTQDGKGARDAQLQPDQTSTTSGAGHRDRRRHPPGWEAAPENRRAWWVGRAQMAKSEAETDSGKDRRRVLRRGR